MEEKKFLKDSSDQNIIIENREKASISGVENVESFDEEKIVIATNKFKPDNILVGQGFIAAQSRNQAVEWLKIIKTALIFVEDNKEELSEELSLKRRSKPPEVREDYDIPNTFENFWE